jgi:tRNA(Ile)-lysidine synthase TilS/MesJ
MTKSTELDISLPIATPPWTALGKKLDSLCRKALFDFQLLEGIDQLAIALSGGKDSLTLLYLLKAILGRGFPKVKLHAIHVSGEFSCGPGFGLPFLRGICHQLDVPLTVKVSHQKWENLRCYSCSRERRKCIFDATKELGVTTVAFGHHQDDSVETLLLNLLHKAEFAANLAKVPMIDYGVTIIRPLIYVEEVAIERFAKKYGFAKITCQCPVGQNSKRRQVKELLKQVEEIFPNARTNLAKASHVSGLKKALRP